MAARRSWAKRTRTGQWVGVTAASVAAALALLGSAVPAFAAASTLGLDKSASVVSARPGQEFTYTLVPRCSGLTEACLNASVEDVLPPEVEVTALPPSTAERRVTFDAATRRLRIDFLVPLPPPSPAGSVGLPAGSSANVQLGVRIPPDSAVLNGVVVPNTATVSADNAPSVSDRADVTVDVPREVRPVATKAWSDGEAVAGTRESGTMTLGVRNASSTTAEVSALTIEDATTEVFERFDVTGVGPVTFPAGADRVQVLACTVVARTCAPADYTASPAQTGPALTLPPGVGAGDVTGLRFVFTNAAGAPLPRDTTGGTVAVGTRLRDTLRSTGDPYAPTSRDDVENCAVPRGEDPVLGDVAGAAVCATYTVQPAQATMSLAKRFFPDGNADYREDGQAVFGQNSLVSGLITAKNTSPFPVATLTIVEPSTTAPSEFDKLDVLGARIVFPTGAALAEASLVCEGTTITRTYVPPPATVDVPVACPSGRVQGLSVTFTGTTASGDGTISPGAEATFGIQGRLNDEVTEDDVVGGSSAGVVNCASGTATSSIDGVGSAAAGACGTVAVQPAFADVTGVKSAERPTILPGLPRSFDLSFTNRGTVPATGVTLTDPVDPTADGGPFDAFALSSLILPASPAAVAEVWDPDAAAYVPYDAGDAALLSRATGFRVRLVDALAPRATYRLSARVLLRDGVDLGTRIQNCAAVGSDAQATRTFCAGPLTVTEASEGASIQKSITPSTSVRPRPGLPGTPIQVKLAAQNTGTLWLKRLVVRDVDPDFFDAVDVLGTIRVNFPPSADRVQVDACTGACGDGDFVLGTRTSSRTPSLPAGVDPGDVRGIRVTFTVSDDSFTIKPGTNFPGSGTCTAASVCLDVRPRATLHSDPATAVPDSLEDTADGGYETTAQGGDLAPVPDTSATHELTDGTAALRLSKSGDVAAGPGEPIPFTLTLTNAGTGPLTDPVISDPLPPSLDFVPSDPATPYTVTITQPDGAPPSDQPDFTVSRTDGRVSGLRWEFPGLVLLPGGSISVTIRTELAPGVAAGASIENRAGGSSSREDLTCADGAPRPGTATDDPAFGDGLFCTSAAVVRALAGNAVRTAKWVAGDTALGWLNSVSGEHLPLGDPTCPQLDVDDVLYTRYPCVARVLPGRGFDFYLTATNAGTNPLTELRVVDVFPVRGDTGVILTDQERGTQWAQPPTLLGPVVLAGPGSLDATYDTGATPCTSDLDRPPSACSPGSWESGWEGSTAFRALLSFDGGLPPGRSAALRFRMAAPAAPTEPVPDEVAWNSFAHTEFFDDDGATVQLPPTEPIKTGIALVFGDLTVRKQVVDSDQGGPFAFAYDCRVTPEVPGGIDGDPVLAAQGTFLLRADEELDLTGLPSGARCRVWETDSAGLVGDAEGEENAKTVVVTDTVTTGPEAVTITNREAPTPSPSPTPTATPPPSPSPSASPTSSPTASPTQSSGPTPTAGPSTPGGGPSSPGAGPGDAGPGGPLAFTGGSLPLLLSAAAALLLAGAALLVLSHRRRAH